MSTSIKPTIVFFFNDWRISPVGANCGGGEIATMATAESMAKLGYRVIACGNLLDPEGVVRGVEYWSFGEEYDLSNFCKRLKALGPYYAFAATLVHPFLFLKDDPNCLAKVVINHSPGLASSGLEPRTSTYLVDRFVCVSEEQKKNILSRGDVPEEKFRVIKNAFNPELFKYAGPEGRDWSELVFVGRLEQAKGIHLILAAYTNLLEQFPHLKLSVFGTSKYWRELHDRVPSIEEQFPGITFHGRVPQRQIAKKLQTAGILVFPSISFESAGLGVLDAQASGCPVVANRVGGVPEYTFENDCGLLVDDFSNPTPLRDTLASLLSDTTRLETMSRNCLRLARQWTWDNVAEALIAQAIEVSEGVPTEKEQKTSRSRTLQVIESNEFLQRSYSGASDANYEEVLEAHDHISNGSGLSDETLSELITTEVEKAPLYFWDGLRKEKRGEKSAALESFRSAHKHSERPDWQVLFRMLLLEAETGELDSAAKSARCLIEHYPSFPFRDDLERLVGELQ